MCYRICGVGRKREYARKTSIDNTRIEQIASNHKGPIVESA